MKNGQNKPTDEEQQQPTPAAVSPIPGKKKGSMDIDMKAITAGLKKLFASLKKHLVLIFIIMTLSALIYAIVAVNTLLAEQPSTEIDAAARAKYNSSFDKKTIDAINDLRSAEQAPNISLPGGRINPFYE